MKKRIISIVCVLILCLSLVPISSISASAITTYTYDIVIGNTSGSYKDEWSINLFEKFTHTGYYAPGVKKGTLSRGNGVNDFDWMCAEGESKSVAIMHKNHNSNIYTIRGNKPGYCEFSLGFSTTPTYLFRVTVKNAPSSVYLDTYDLTLGKGESYTLANWENSGAYSNNCVWTYYPTYTSVKTGTDTCKVTAKNVGKASVSVTTYNKKSATCNLTIKNAPKSISLNKTSITLGIGETFDLDSYVNSGAAAYYRPYSSSNSNVASVAKSGGLVKAKAVGKAKITVKTYNGKTATCTVTVKKAPTKVSLNKTNLKLKVGQTFDLNSSVPSGTAAYHIGYSSNKPNVASVKTAGGLVTAKSKGTAVITAKTYNGKTVTCKVAVI